MKLSHLQKLRIAQYSVNIGAYAGLSVLGIFTGLPEGSPLLYFRPESWAININMIIPLVFCLFGAVAVLKDQLAAYFKFPKGVGVAIVFFILGFLAWLISYWLMFATGLYLILTLINTLYFNPQILEEIELAKAIKKERLIKESKNNG